MDSMKILLKYLQNLKYYFYFPFIYEQNQDERLIMIPAIIVNGILIVFVF